MNKITIAFVEMCHEDGEELATRPSLKQLLLSDVGRGELVLPARGQAPRRTVQEIE